MATYDLTTLMAQGVPLRFGDRSATGNDTFDYAPGKPNLFMLMNLKHLLQQTHGIVAGFELFRRTVPKLHDSRLVLRRLHSQHSFALAQARSFAEIVPAGEPITILPPTVIGDGNHRPLTNVTRSFHVACLTDVILQGRSSILISGDLALADFQADELARIDDELEFDAAIFHRDGDDVWMMDSGRPARLIPEAFSLLGCRTDFFGDWLCEFVTKFVAAMHSGHLPPVPVLIDADMNASHREALELMMPDIDIIEIAAFEPVQVQRLWLASSIGYMAFHQKLNERFKWEYVLSSPERFLPVEDEMARRADLVLGPARGPERVFLARKGFRHRKVVNSEEIEAIAAAQGFAIVYPEEFDFVEQVRLLRGARYVIAPEGSALFLMYFLDAGAKVCILNHQETDGLVLYNGGSDAKGIDLTIITGPEAGVRRGRSLDMDYRIDPVVFADFLAGWFPVSPRLTERV